MKGSMESMVSKDHRTVDSGENLIGPYQHLNIFRSMIVVGHWPCFDRFEVLYLKFKCSNPENGPVKVLAGTVSDGNIYIYLYFIYIYIYLFILYSIYCTVHTINRSSNSTAVTPVPWIQGTAVTFLSDRDDFQARQIKSVMLRNKQEIPRELQAEWV